MTSLHNHGTKLYHGVEYKIKISQIDCLLLFSKHLMKKYVIKHLTKIIWNMLMYLNLFVKVL